MVILSKDTSNYEPLWMKDYCHLQESRRYKFYISRHEFSATAPFLKEKQLSKQQVFI